jgi:hypothetical protein
MHRHALLPGNSPLKLSPAVLLLCAAGSFCAAAQPPFTGPDLSGTYACKGDDHKEGAYGSTVTLKLVREQSFGAFGAYDFLMQVPGYGSYPGHAAANGRNAAIYFANADAATKDYGTGLAKFSKTASGKWRFDKYYYEPEFKGGNYGTESCVQK